MNFTKFDMSLFFVMTIAIICMTFVFPEIGLVAQGGDTNVSSGDIPELTIDGNRFDIAGDLPNRPGTPATGELDFNASDVDRSDNRRVADGGSTNAELNLLDDPFSTNESVGFIQLRVRDSSDGSTVGVENATFNESGRFFDFSVDAWSVEFDITEYNESGVFAADYKITSRDESDDGGFIESIPVIGGLFSTGKALASTVAWIGSVFWWFLTFIFELGLNLIAILIDTVTFGFGMLIWLFTTYAAVIEGSEGFATVFVAIPGVIQSLLFAKLAFISLKLLPST